MLMTIKFSLKMSERAFVCQLALLNIDTYSNILIESWINTNEMFSRVNEKRFYVIDITFGIMKVYFLVMNSKRCKAPSIHFFSYHLFKTWNSCPVTQENVTFMLMILYSHNRLSMFMIIAQMNFLFFMNACQ